MAEYTPYLNLKKPAPNEFYNVEDFNDNADLIDAEMEQRADGIGALQQTVNAHLADDVTQGDIPHTGLGGSISHATNTGEVTTPHFRQVNASNKSVASGSYSQVNASDNSVASGELSQVNASRDCENGGRGSAIIACGAYDIDGRGAKIVDRVNAVIIASRGVELSDNFSLAGGMTQGPPSVSNRKWQIYSQSGDIQIAGQLTPGHSFTDFAELFPNLTGQKQGYGLLQTIDGFGVRPANEGERVIGVTSATAGIILGDTPFSWQGRWLKNEWGEYIYETIIDEETGEEITYPKENPEWNPELEQVSRLKRPDEWTVVGLLGQVYVRLKEDVQPMDYVKAWQNGVGQKSLEPTNLQVMKITQEYDAEKGYKIGFCLLR